MNGLNQSRARAAHRTPSSLRGALLAAVGACAAWLPGTARACPSFANDFAAAAARYEPPQTTCLICHQADGNGLFTNPRNLFGADWRTDCGRCMGSVPNCGATPSCNPMAWLSCAAGRASDADSDTLSNREELEDTPPTLPYVPNPVNECSPGRNPCANEADCSDGPVLGDYECTCPPNLDGPGSDGLASGEGCVDVDECALGTDDCDSEENDAVCTNVRGSWECSCAPGFFGSGREGEGCDAVNTCDPNPCNPLSACVPLPGTADCRACPPGFAGDPADCPNCPEGYAGDGRDPGGCVPVSACDLVTNGGCHPDVQCIAVPSGRRCGDCPSGSVGDGYGPDGCVPEPCASCSPFANCTPDATTPCACNVGFSGDGETCVDVNECDLQNQANCGANSTCVNVPGSYVCTCNAGFAGADCSEVEEVVGSGGSGSGGGSGELQGSGGNALEPEGPEPTGGSNVAGAAPSSGAGGAGAPGGGDGGCSFVTRPRGSPNGTASAACFALGALLLLRRRGRRRCSALGTRLLAVVSLVAFLACGDESSPAPAVTADAGAGGSSATGGTGDMPEGGSGGGEPVSLSGSGGQTPPPDSIPDPEAPLAGCTHSSECAASEWCNPRGRACENREPAGETVSFRQVFNEIQTLGCTTCHTPGGRGIVTQSGFGPLQLDDFELGYQHLAGSGVNCRGGQRRLCVDDPASSLLITKVFDGLSDTPESVVFGDWSEDQLQLILRWIARGAPRDGLCGNFIRDTGEACDQGPNPRTRCAYGETDCDLCSRSCTSVAAVAGPRCGDGVLDRAFEICDDGNLAVEEVGPNGGATCGSACTFVAGTVCGGLNQACCSSPSPECDNESLECTTGTCVED